MSLVTMLSLAVQFAIFTITIAALNPFQNEGNVFGNCQAKVGAVYEVPDTRLSELNLWFKGDKAFQDLVAAGCPPDRDDTDVCQDKPAVGSGFAQIGANEFLGLADRGPNLQCEDLYEADPNKYPQAKGKTGRSFPVPAFAPTIVYLSPRGDSREMPIIKSIPLRGRDLKPITGLPNTMLDEVPYGPGCRGDPLPYDPSGLDTEDIALIPGTDYVALVDEHSPSVVVANYKTGKITSRHVPRKLRKLLKDAPYKIVGDMLNIYTQRRKNRGFEGVVVDNIGKYVIAIVQSPMIGESGKFDNNAIIRCAYFDMEIRNGIPMLSYSWSFIIEASSPAAYADPSVVPKDMKYSAAQYHSKSKFIALERASGQVKLFLVDFSKATNIDNTLYNDSLSLERLTKGVFLPEQFKVKPAEKALVWDSIPGVGGTTNYDGGDKIEGFAIDMMDDSKLWVINDNDFGLEKNTNTMIYKISLGRAPAGATICKPPAHPRAPKVNLMPTKAIRLVSPSTYRVTDEPDAGAAENLDVNEMKKRVYVANGDTGSVDMYDGSSSPVQLIKSYVPEGNYEPTSIAVCEKHGYVATGLASDEDDMPGRIDILAANLRLIQKVQKSKCILVDHVKWTDDCKFLVGACEGEGKDVPGGVVVIDYGGPKGNRFRKAEVGTFEHFNPLERFFDENGIRLIESRTPSVDLEPEYITFVGNHAFVTVQENNAIAVVDLFEAKITELKPIGYINHGRMGFEMDTSDKDGRINVRRQRNVYGMPQPDAIQSYTARDGETYLVFANEGDAKDDEEARGEDITDEDGLGRIAGLGLAKRVDNDEELGRLKFSSIIGYNETTNTQEQMFSFGSRSFAIMKATTGEIVFDSGSWFAKIQEKYFPKIFNSQSFDDEDLSLSQEDLFDNRYVVFCLK